MLTVVQSLSLQAQGGWSPAKLGHLEHQHINQLWPINPTISALDLSI